MFKGLPPRQIELLSSAIAEQTVRSRRRTRRRRGGGRGGEEESGDFVEECGP